MLTFIVAAGLYTVQANETVTLACRGAGTRRNLYNGSEFQDTIRVEIWDNGGRIQLPAAMLPPEMRGGEDGWWTFRDFIKSPKEYKAKVRVNFINFPTVTIDRLTGAIRIDGGQSGFSGTCEKIDANASALF